MKSVAPYVLMVTVSLGLSLVVAEGVLRTTKLAEPLRVLKPVGPMFFEPHPVRGWAQKPGRFLVPRFSADGHETHYTFLADRSRATSEQMASAAYDLVFVGCSITQAFAVSDEDSFAWKVQSALPAVRVGNLGVGGYGTFQSLLLLRELYARGARPRTVIYGFLPFHAERNIAHAGWLRVLAQYSRLGHETLPFASLDDNGVLLEHGPAPFRAFPFREQLALADLAAKVHFKFLDPEERRRRRDAQQVTCKLISDMNRLARRNGSAFYVALLGQLRELGPFPPAYESCCRESGVETIDCRIDLGEEYIVRGESHPNEEAHAIWAECLTSHLRNRHGT